MAESADAVVVGSGPNGLAAAITLARAGRSVIVLEANDTIGGACRSAELTEPGVIHDLGSAIHPMGRGSQFFVEIANDLARHGLKWVVPPAGVAHPLDDGRAGIAWNELDRTVDALGEDGPHYRRIFEPFVNRSEEFLDLALNPLVRRPRDPLLAARFGALAALPASTLAKRTWKTDEAQALFAGHAGHAILPLTAPFTSSFGLLLGSLVHSVGWGFPQGGAQSLTDAMVAYLQELGGEVRTGVRVDSLESIPQFKALILALTPVHVDAIAGDRFTESFRGHLQRWRYGSAAWKLDYVLDGPIPWTNPEVSEAGTVHVGGPLGEMVESTSMVADGGHPAKPFVLVAQHSNFDPTRAPDGMHTVWAYSHVPNGSDTDRSDAMESQIERFAPGFKDLIRTRHVTSPALLERDNASLVGGDIGGGSHAGRQLFFRPRPTRSPFDTSDPQIFVGSASTTPGGGVHGMGGYGAARRALTTVLG